MGSTTKSMVITTLAALMALGTGCYVDRRPTAPYRSGFYGGYDRRHPQFDVGYNRWYYGHQHPDGRRRKRHENRHHRNEPWHHHFH
jgi:hypothetical protein